MKPAIKRRFWLVAIAVLLAIIVLCAIIFIDASAVSITEATKRCTPSIEPVYLGCAMAAHEGLAAGLIGAAGAIWAAMLAYTAVQMQIAAEREARQQQQREEQERIRRQQDSEKEVVKVCILPAIRAAAAAMVAIDAATANPGGLKDTVDKAFNHLQAMLNSSGLRESFRDLATEDRVRCSEIVGMLSNLISINVFGHSNPHERLLVLRGGFDKVHDMLKDYDPELAKEFAAGRQVLR